jgi:hypothetical protein
MNPVDVFPDVGILFVTSCSRPSKCNGNLVVRFDFDFLSSWVRFLGVPFEGFGEGGG